MNRTALIVVDVQKDFCEEGSLAVAGGNTVARRIRTFIDYNALEPDYLISTRDWHIDPGGHFALPPAVPDYKTSWPVHCVANTEGAEYHDALRGVNWDAEFKKGEYDAAYSGFQGVISRNHTARMSMSWYFNEQRITNLYIAGLATDYCVRATAFDALRNGFKVTVLKDLCAGVAEKSTKEALDELELFGAVLA